MALGPCHSFQHADTQPHPRYNSTPSSGTDISDRWGRRDCCQITICLMRMPTVLPNLTGCPPAVQTHRALQKPCAFSARVRICGVGPPSATSEIHTGDGPPHPSCLQPHLKCLCSGGSAPAKKSAVQENVRRGLHDVQKNEWFLST